MIKIFKMSKKGSFKKIERFLKRDRNPALKSILQKYGEIGVQRLASATPIDSGITALSWSYNIERTTTGWNLNFDNSNINKGVKIALLLQYGHGTVGGGWVEGIDYINPALRPVFQSIVDEIWKEVTK